ncbi:Vitamin D receptor [Aphelenchoides fujianensis]|nr:Vitamin D receptor [Aphelenchoides fujianensis]
MSAQCAICGGQPAARHFGGMSCRSCKGFFRRCLKLNRKYVCSLGNSCTISKTARFYCRACRWRLCLEAGMNALLVHSDRSIDTCKKPRKPSMSETNGELVPYDPRSAGSSTSSSSTFWDVDLNETNLCTAMIESSRRTQMPNYGPLGVRNLLRPFNPSHPPSVVHYLLEVDRLLDNFDEEYLHLEHCSQPDLNQPLEIAFLFEPAADSPTERSSFGNLCARQHSTISQFWTLDFEDQVKLAVGRCIPSGPLATASRAVKVPGKKCLLLPGGYYFLLAEDEEEDRKK